MDLGATRRAILFTDCKVVIDGFYLNRSSKELWCCNCRCSPVFAPWGFPTRLSGSPATPAKPGFIFFLFWIHQCHGVARECLKDGFSYEVWLVSFLLYMTTQWHDYMRCPEMFITCTVCTVPKKHTALLTMWFATVVLPPRIGRPITRSAVVWLPSARRSLKKVEVGNSEVGSTFYWVHSGFFTGRAQCSTTQQWSSVSCWKSRLLFQRCGPTIPLRHINI